MIWIFSCPETGQGRLEDMTLEQSLLAPCIKTATMHAQTLDQINATTRDSSKDVDEASRAVEQVKVKSSRVVIVIHQIGTKCHWSSCLMLKETHHLPTIAMAQDADESILKGHTVLYQD